MEVKVRVPNELRMLTGNRAEVIAAGETISVLVGALDAAYPGIGERVLEPGGKRRKFVNVYVNGKHIRSLAEEATALADGDEVDILPVIAGG